MTDPNWETRQKVPPRLSPTAVDAPVTRPSLRVSLGSSSKLSSREDATHVIRDGEEITASCCEGDTGHIYRSCAV
jgi:pyruvate,water dikinase